ncbi:hypothetical protein [Streptomyces ipomoeae]|uniref:hypothetical protein n=1 Tax=Streptomyces ipomoeae TaxID=103232 RepID=UPI0029A76364|nr:hypothetical protein [Streptomyces ipomoeae]MDX2696237.1 hypothetical protein [Streptomyces ipomoeae]MDX2839348.1 hypothetical protein [Streptomyces ipomoeae]
MSATTGDPLVLWLVITGSALTTGLILWLLKVLIDTSTDTAPADEHDHDQGEEPRLTWLLAWPSTGAPLCSKPTPPASHIHTPACSGETLQITSVQPSRARHAKRTNS